MNLPAIHRLLPLLPITFIVGCVCKPPQPLPAKDAGVAFFIVSGSETSLESFRNKFRDPKTKPPRCTEAVAESSTGEERSEPGESILYRCEDTKADTFTSFGTLFNNTTRGNLTNAQASLEALYTAQADNNPLRIVATTTPCDHTYCKKFNSYGPWMPNKVCLQFCQ